MKNQAYSAFIFFKLPGFNDLNFHFFIIAFLFIAYFFFLKLCIREINLYILFHVYGSLNDYREYLKLFPDHLTEEQMKRQKNPLGFFFLILWCFFLSKKSIDSICPVNDPFHKVIASHHAVLALIAYFSPINFLF